MADLGEETGRPGPAFLFLDQTEAASEGQKKFFWRPPPPYLRVWMTGCPPLFDGLDLPLYNNIATTHLCLQSLCFPCSRCCWNILRYSESQSLRFSLWASSGDETENKLSDNLVQALAFRCLILVHLAFFAVFLFCECFV